NRHFPAEGGHVFVSPRSASQDCAVPPGSVGPVKAPALSPRPGTRIDELNGKHLSIETDTLLQAEDNSENVEIDGTLSSSEPARQEEKETFASFGVHHEIVSS